MKYAPLDDEVLRESYARHGNLWRVAEELSVSHSRVHRRLVALGIERSIRHWTDDERARLRELYPAYAAESRLDELVTIFQRPKSKLCREAARLGLTHRSRPWSAKHRKNCEVALAGKWGRSPHPRGMAGKKHAEETKAAVGEASRAAWARMKATGTGNMHPKNLQAKSDQASARMALTPASNAYSRTKSGVRADLGIFVRSAWEANYARYLNWLQARADIDRWEYEPETFWFAGIKRGVRSYRPDFKIWEKGSVYFVEVKGWMDAKSKTKLRRMKKYYPHIEVRLFDEADYRSLSSQLSRIIPHWEGR